MPSLWHYIRRAPSKFRKMFLAERAERVHVGSGDVHLEGWINVDNVRYPGVDRIIDVTYGLPFRDVRFLFAEHFIEHLGYSEAMYFLLECRRVLRDDGVLRLTTPSLDWVWETHYRRKDMKDCFEANRAFRAWGHQFLYNFDTLESTLHAAGFDRVIQREYGESDHPELRGIEHHPRDEEGDVIVVEASGRRRAAADETFTAVRDQYLTDLNVR